MKAFHEQRKYQDGFAFSIEPVAAMDFLPHWHQDYEILYIFSGQQQIAVGDRLVELSAGQGLLIAPWQVHYYKKIAEAQGILVIFRPELLPYMEIDTSAHWQVDRQEELKAWVENLLRDIAEERRRKEPYFTWVCQSKIQLLLATLARREELGEWEWLPKNRQGELDLIQEILSYLEVAYAEGLSRDRLAQKFGLSTSHFSRLFKRLTGLSLPEYVGRLRVEEAAKLLLASDNTITQIAYEVGFDSVRSFNRSFQGVYQITPSLFRQEKNALRSAPAVLGMDRTGGKGKAENSKKL